MAGLVQTANMGVPKYPLFKDSGPKSHLGYEFWGSESLYLGYLDPLGPGQHGVPKTGTPRRDPKTAGL